MMNNHGKFILGFLLKVFRSIHSPKCVVLTEVATESDRLIKDNLSAQKNSNETFGKKALIKTFLGINNVSLN